METIVTIREAEDADVPTIQRIARETLAFSYEGVIPEDVQDQASRSWYSSQFLKTEIPATTNRLLESVGCAMRTTYCGVVERFHATALHRLQLHVYAMAEVRRT